DMRTPPSMPQRGLNHERRILLLAVLVAAPGLLMLAAWLWWSGVDSGVWLAVFATVELLSLVLAVYLRRRVVFPLYTLSNLLEALREGDFSLRGTRARRGDAIGEVIWEINALSETLRQQRLRVE